MGPAYPPARRLARDAYAHTAAYDAAIVTWFDRTADEPELLPRTIHLALERADVLRYGENPHQHGARYRRVDEPGIWDRVEQHAGVALSYLNLFDADAAWRLAHDMGGPAAVAIIKHANPCGAAIGSDLATPTPMRSPATLVRRSAASSPATSLSISTRSRRWKQLRKPMSFSLRASPRG